MKHTGTLIEVRECLAQCIDNLHSIKEYNTDRYYEALQKLDALIADVPEGLGAALNPETHLRTNLNPDYESRQAVLKAAKLLCEAVEVGE